MNKLLKQALFIVPIAAIVVAPVIIPYIKNIGMAPHAKGDNSYNVEKAPSSAKTSNTQKYSMPEPFANVDTFGMTYPIQKSIDPNTWMQMLTNMVSPRKTSPEVMCALCHQGEDMARYQKDFGLIMDSMWEPYKAMMNPHMMLSFMNPNAYMGMMNPTMYMNMMYPMMGMMGPMMGALADPKQYEKRHNEKQIDQGE